MISSSPDLCAADPMLFDVLNLFAELLQFRFHQDNFARDDAIARLGTDRIDLAIHFLREKVEQLKHEVLDSEAVRHYLEALWDALHGWLQADVRRDDSVIHAQSVMLVGFVGQKLYDDEAVQGFINEQILIEAPAFVEGYRTHIGRFIEEQIHSWTSEKLVLEFERAIGPDLQYIRINGTVVGATVGLGIYSLTQLLIS